MKLYNSIKNILKESDSKLTEGNWEYQLKSGKDLRKAINDNDDSTESWVRVLNAIKTCCEELKTILGEDDVSVNNLVDDCDFYIDTIDTEEDESNIDYCLDQLYDICDGNNIWVPLMDSEKLKESNEEPEEDKSLDIKDRVLRAYDNCHYSLRADMPTIKDILEYLGMSDTRDNRNLVCNIIYKAGKDWQIEEAANPENAEANALIRQALDDKKFAAEHKKDLEKLGLRVDVNEYTKSDGTKEINDVYLTGPNGRKLKSAYFDWDSHSTGDFKPQDEAYKKDGVNQYDDSTGEYKNLKDLDHDFTLSRRTYGDSKDQVSRAKDGLDRLKKRLSLYAKRYGEDSYQYRKLKDDIESRERIIARGVQPSYSENKSKDVDYLNYLNKPLRSDRPQARKTYRDGTERDKANELSMKYKKAKADRDYNDRQKAYNLERDREDEERVQDIIKRNKEEKDRRDYFTAKADKSIDKDFSDIAKRLDAYKKRIGKK